MNSIQHLHVIKALNIWQSFVGDKLKQAKFDKAIKGKFFVGLGLSGFTGDKPDSSCYYIQNKKGQYRIVDDKPSFVSANFSNGDFVIQWANDSDDGHVLHRDRANGPSLIVFQNGELICVFSEHGQRLDDPEGFSDAALRAQLAPFMNGRMFPIEHPEGMIHKEQAAYQ